MEALERLERDIDKEVAKLKHYMEPADKLIENNDYLEMKIAVKQGSQIISKIMDLISQLESMKLDFEASARDVRQWKKDKKNEFSPFVQEGDKISDCGREGHGASHCRSRPCFKCKSRHHTNLCDRHLVNGPSDGKMFTAYNPGSED